MSSNFVCDTCSLVFCNEEEMVEHFCSLPHHIRQSRSQQNSKQLCLLCQTSYDTLADYSRHLDTDVHSRMLERFRSSGTTSRQEQQTSRSVYKDGRGWKQPERRNYNERPVRVPLLPLPTIRPPASSFVWTRPPFDRHTPPPWYPPNLPHTLRFGTNEPFHGHASSFRPGQQCQDTASTYSSMDVDPSGYRQTGVTAFTSTGRPAITQSSTASVEPAVPLDPRNLGSSDRVAPTTAFRKKMLSQIRAKKKKARVPISQSKVDNNMETIGIDENTVSSCADNVEEGTSRHSEASSSKQTASSPKKKSKKKAKSKKKRLHGKDKEAASSNSNEPQRQAQEADSTTCSRKVSTVKRSKDITSAVVKRRRLIAKAQRISDRLLADRLNRYRVTTAAAGGKNTSAIGDASSSVSTSTMSMPRIDAGVRKRARDLFMGMTIHSAGSVPTESTMSTVVEQPSDSSVDRCNDDHPTSAQDIREPKRELSEESPTDPDSVSSGNTVNNSTTQHKDNVPAVSVVTESSDGEATKRAEVPDLHELWRLCKMEEDIRDEERRVNEEMERLKGELQKVWYRQKELQKQAAECAAKKQQLLHGAGKAETQM